MARWRGGRVSSVGELLRHSSAPTYNQAMKIEIELNDAWTRRFHDVSERMGCEGEDVFGRALSLAHVITHHLAEPGARVILESPSEGPARLNTDALYR